MTADLRLSLAPGVQLLDDPVSAHAVLEAGGSRLTATSDSMSSLFRELGRDGLPTGPGGSTAPVRPLAKTAVVARLVRLGWLCQVAYGADGELARAVPSPTALPAEPPAELPAASSPGGPAGRVVLSRFAFAEVTAEGLSVSSPRASRRVVTRHPAVLALLARLGAPADADTLRATGLLSARETGIVLGLLASSGLLRRVAEDGRVDEDDDVALRQWEPHDLAFHARTRAGLDTGSTGATYRFRGELEPLPAVKPRGGGRVVPLESAPVRPEVGFDAVLRDRRSIREHAEQPIALTQVGQLLHRAARFTSLQQLAEEQVVSRPYPGGGALHELELYLVVHRCDALEPGVYHYRAADHELEHVTDPGQASEALLRDAGYSMGTGRSPQVLVVVAARFPRLSWKYQSIAYALVLKHVGCLLQTLYLVATSMGLAPCGIGGGDSAQFARLLPGSPYAETSVGELALGVPAPGASTLVDP